MVYDFRTSFLCVFAYAWCKVISMGSKGTGSLAHMAYSIRVESSVSPNSFSSKVLSVLKSYRCFRYIVFFVMVPVLSVQMTVVLPRVSTMLLLLMIDRKSTRLNSSHVRISYAVFCLKKKKTMYTIWFLIFMGPIRGRGCC